NPNNETNSFTYHAEGQLLTLTDGKNQTIQWQYDQFGRVTNHLDATTASVVRFTYDADGRVTDRWSAQKGDTLYTYDNVGNVTFVNYPVSSDITFAYDALNRLTNMADAVGTTLYTYTSTGNLQSEDGPWESDTLTYGYTPAQM